jgi:calcineurin-like phosphoesterase family protein
MTLDPKNTFFISDPHFDHVNILRYANRPFRSVEEMNDTILRRYNEVVRDDSLVFFLGDMAFGRGSRTPKWWLSQLRGHIIYIKGSHDHGIRPTNTVDCHDVYVLDTGAGKVLLTHEPSQAHDRFRKEQVKMEWEWMIHGHTHDTRLINVQRRSVCVCVEAINYRPISLQQIREAINGVHYSPEMSKVRR